ncbi:MAG: hypothetical protein ACK50V_01930 [Alphaproteobacteria bacterium]|nr:hypothetical protein [Alphaproteobacteria bacterium]
MLTLTWGISVRAGEDSVLLLAFTASEAKSFESVSKELERINVPHSVVGLGVAHAILKDHPHALSLKVKCGLRAPVHRPEWPSKQRLPEGDLLKLSGCLDPHVTMLGTYARVQAQIASIFRKKGSYVISFYDDFYRDTPQIMVKSALPRSHEILLPTPQLLPFFQKIFPHIQTHVTGRPNNETWLIARKRVNKVNLQRKMIPPGFVGRKILFYLGGYGRDYNDSFEELVKFVKQKPELLAIYSPYPGDNGKREMSLIQMYGVSNFIALPKEVPVEEAVYLADRILCHRSNTGIQAAFAGLAVGYYDTNLYVYQNPLIDKGIVPHLQTQQDLHKFMDETYAHPRYTPEALSQKMNWPLGAARTIALRIKERLRDRLHASSLQGLPWQTPGILDPSS